MLSPSPFQSMGEGEHNYGAGRPCGARSTLQPAAGRRLGTVSLTLSSYMLWDFCWTLEVRKGAPSCWLWDSQYTMTRPSGIELCRREDHIPVSPGHSCWLEASVKAAEKKLELGFLSQSFMPGWAFPETPCAQGLIGSPSNCKAFT